MHFTRLQFHADKPKYFSSHHALQQAIKNSIYLPIIPTQMIPSHSPSISMNATSQDFLSYNWFSETYFIMNIDIQMEWLTWMGGLDGRFGNSPQDLTSHNWWDDCELIITCRGTLKLGWCLFVNCFPCFIPEWKKNFLNDLQAQWEQPRISFGSSTFEEY